MRSRYLLLLPGAVLAASVAFSQTTWCVAHDAASGGDGTSWATAFQDVQTAIDSAADGDDIWVKGGVYALPDRITVYRAVDIYGGFNGDETSLDQRDWVANPTTLSGPGSVRCMSVPHDSRIDGLIIANGDRPDSPGGGAYVLNGDGATFANCTFDSNIAEDGGGDRDRLR